jgi:hypothetical protein
MRCSTWNTRSARLSHGPFCIATKFVLAKNRARHAEPAISRGAQEVGVHVARNEVFHVEHT